MIPVFIHGGAIILCHRFASLYGAERDWTDRDVGWLWFAIVSPVYIAAALGTRAIVLSFLTGPTPCTTAAICARPSTPPRTWAARSTSQ
jgi:hypothetical protein